MRYDLCTCIYISTYAVVYDAPFATPVTNATAGKPFTRGSKVWNNNPVVPRGQSKKIHRFWKGPYTVLDIWDNCVYKIKQDAVPQKQHTVHFDRLKPYVEWCRNVELVVLDIKPKEGEEEDELDMMVLPLQDSQDAAPQSGHRWMGKNLSWLTTLEMMEKQWNLLQWQMTKPKIDIAPPADNICQSSHQRWPPERLGESGFTFKSTHGRVVYGGGRNGTVSRAPCIN